MNAKRHLKSVLFSALICLLLVFIVMYPQEIIDASREGLFLWFNNIFPSLFPFAVISQLLLGLGVVNFLGTLLEPLMRPLLNVPGEGALCFAIGITSGYPMGAKLIASLRNLKSCTKYEAERLMSFCNSAGPLFIIGAIGAGIFDNSKIGYLLLLCNYAALITTGFIFKRYGRAAKSKRYVKSYKTNIFKKAIINMTDAQKEDGRSINIIFSDAVRDGINSMLMIGGYIIAFSVIVKLLNITGVTSMISNAVYYISGGYIPHGLTTGIINGIFEMTVGCKSLKSLSLSMYHKTMLAGFILAWGGFSTHAQVIGELENTDISYVKYFLAKVIHGIITPLYISIAYPLIIKSKTAAAFNAYGGWLDNFTFSLLMIVVVTMVILALAVINGLAVKNKY